MVILRVVYDPSISIPSVLDVYNLLRKPTDSFVVNEEVIHGEISLGNNNSQPCTLEVQKSGESSLGNDNSQTCTLKMDKHGEILAGSDNSPTCTLKIDKHRENGYSINYLELKLNYTCCQDKLSETLEELVSNILGYKMILLQGFTVKDTTGVRIKPCVPVFVKNTPFLHADTTLHYNKHRVALQPKFLDKESSNLETDSIILKSILRHGPMSFVSENSSVYIFSLDDRLYIRSTQEENKLDIRAVKVQALCNNFINKITMSNCWFTPILIKAYTTPDSPSMKEELRECLRKLHKQFKFRELEFLRKMLEMVPKFHDHRDEHTKALSQLYSDNALTTKLGDTSNYLALSNTKNVDWIPLGSLKRFYSEHYRHRHR